MVTLKPTLRRERSAMVNGGLLFILSLVVAVVLLSMLRPHSGAAGHKR